MAKKQFKAESKRLLDLMIHSIYTHKEIFLRELISNASDAIDKLYYKSLSSDNTGLSREDFEIFIKTDKETRTLSISDNGIGMTKDELESNLGTIARSGSLAFKNEQMGAAKPEAAKEDGSADKEVEDKEAEIAGGTANSDIDIIGQFGVGFYSAFMVADKVTVISRAFGEEQAWQWESEGADGYTISEGVKDSHGTEIILTIKSNADEEKYDEFLEEYRIRGLIKRYADYIRYPIHMMVEKSRAKEKPADAPEDAETEYETYQELETLNSMVPLWKKSKSELSTEDYNNFYKEKFYDFKDPLKVIHTSVEGVVSYTALLYVPAQAPYNYYSKDYEKGLQLYSSGVMIMDKCADLLPDCFSFVRGLVDSQDLSLNISREMLQHDRQLKAIASRIEKKIQSELLSMQKNDREKYEEFYKAFGLQLKYGVYEGYGMKKELLKDLLMFHSSSEKKLTTLSEYVARMRPDQKNIYYACGETIERIDKLPQIELLKDKGYEILYLTDNVDEFALKMMMNYEEKEFKSASDEDLEIQQTEEEKEAAKKQAEDNKELLELMKEALSGKVTEVRLSTRLKSHPVCIASGSDLSLEMEKVLASMPNADDSIKADKILELNASHPILAALQKAYQEDKDKVKAYAQLLYNQALLIEGMAIDDPVEFSNAVCNLMV